MKLLKPASFRSSLAACAVALAGCGALAVDPDAGFSDVSSLVTERSGRTPVRDPEAEARPSAAAAIAAELAKGLTAERAVGVALLASRDLQAIYADLKVAQSDLVQASLLHNPIADVAAGFPLSGGTVDLTLGIAVDVIDLLYVPLRTRVAAAELEAVKLEVAGQILESAWNVETAFYRHQADEQSVEMRRRIADASAASYAVAKERRRAGNATELEVASERAMAEEAKLELRLAEIAAVESRERLNALMGLWGKAAAWRLESTRLPEPPAEPPEVDAVERRAVEASLDLGFAKRTLEATAAQLGLSVASALFPEVLVGAEAEREDGAWEVGPSLSIPIPIFDFGQARRARARAEIERAAAAYQAFAIRTRSAARLARERVVGHRDRALFYRSVALPLRERVVRETRLQYHAMQVGPMELLRAKEQQIETAADYVDALREYWLARADLALILAGRVPPGDPVPPPPAIESPRRSPIPALG